MNIKLYVLCYDNDSNRIALNDFSKIPFAEVLEINTTQWLENIMYKTWLNENRDAWKDYAYVGTISYKAKKKLPRLDVMRVCQIGFRRNADVVAFYRGCKGCMTKQGESCHRGFTHIWNTWLDAMNIPQNITQEMTPFYANFWIAKAEWMDKYLEFFQFAVDTLMNHENLRDIAWSDSSYIHGSLYVHKRCQEVFGKPYYPFYIFLLERLPALFFTLKKAKIIYA